MSKSHLEMPHDGECAFCAYLRGTRPYTVLSRTSDTATLVTREPRGDPHLLVLPTRHAPTLLDLSDVEVASVGIALRTAAETIDRVYKKPGIAVWQNNGVPAGQAISHFHFHVAGTLAKGGTEFGKVREVSVEETDAIARLLRSA